MGPTPEKKDSQYRLRRIPVRGPPYHRVYALAERPPPEASEGGRPLFTFLALAIVFTERYAGVLRWSAD